MFFIALLKYTKPISEVDAVLNEHRAYINALLKEGKLLVAGRMDPRTGGVIIGKNVTRDEFIHILNHDPFHRVSSYEIVSFTPTFYDECLESVLPKND